MISDTNAQVISINSSQEIFANTKFLLFHEKMPCSSESWDIQHRQAPAITTNPVSTLNEVVACRQGRDKIYDKHSVQKMPPSMRKHGIPPAAISAYNFVNIAWREKMTPYIEKFQYMY